jgi:hypothetical protein
MQFYEFPTDGSIVNTGDPFLHSQLNMLGGPMTLSLVDGDTSLTSPGFQSFFNNVPQVPLNGEWVTVWQGEPIQVEIVALTLTGLEPIAVNEMVPFQFFADDDVNPVLDNAFGIFTGDWSLPLGPDVLLDEDGVAGGAVAPSAFLQEWVDMPQFRWKGHPGGWTQVITGSPLPGPAGIIHQSQAAVPEPSTWVMLLSGCLGLTCFRLRRKRK